MTEAKIKDIEYKLSNSEIIDSKSSENEDQIIFGSFVELLNTEYNSKIKYQLVGEDEADLKNNIVESNIRNSVFPSVKTEGENPTYGDYMRFDLVTETGNINNCYNEIDMGIFRGDNFFTNKNEDVYIDNGMFTSCDNPTPHYFFGSNQMIVDNNSNQIIA